MPIKKTGQFKKCVVCKKKIYVSPYKLKVGWGKCCSPICQHKKQILAVTKICLHCKKEIKIIPSRIKRGGGKFCSYKCRGLFYKGQSFFTPEGLLKSVFKRSNKNHWNWKGGKSREPYGIEWTKTLKESIRLRDNFKCQRCGVDQKECIEALTIHHKNEIKTDLNPINLISYCRSCHIKVHHE